MTTFVSSVSYGQQKSFNKGVKQFERGNYLAALETFNTEMDSASLTNERVHYMSWCYLELHRPEMAREIIGKLAHVDKTNFYNLIWANYLLEEFAEAISLINQSWFKEDSSIVRLKHKIESASRYYKNKKGYIVQNFGPNINSKHREYSAVAFNDYNKLLYTVRKDSTESADIDGLSFEAIHETSIDSIDHWTKPSALTNDFLKEKRHDATVQVYANGEKMVSYHHGKLYNSILKDNTWQNTGELQLHSQSASDTHCYITSNEDTVYFASDFQSEGRDLDLFICTRQEDGKWSMPQPLLGLNTEYNEDSPFLSDDGWLYFSSRGHNSMGGYDIYKSAYDHTTNQWSVPVNLGHPINSVGEDTYYSTHGKLGYLTSSRPEGFGSLDLYRLFLFNKVKVEGKIKSKKGGTPIANAEINLEYDSLFVRGYSDIDGNYAMFMPVNKEMHVTFVKDSLDIIEGDYIVNVFFRDENNNEFNFFIAEQANEPIAIADLDVQPGIKRINIDIKNDFECNPLLAIVPERSEKRWVDSLNTQYLTARFNESLSPQTYEGIKVLYFDFDQFDLSMCNKRILDSLCESSFRQNQHLTVNIQGHTDAIGDFQYNQLLSWQRANSVYEYLISKEVSVKNILVYGAGATKPVGLENDRTSHSKNRRVEIRFHND